MALAAISVVPTAAETQQLAVLLPTSDMPLSAAGERSGNAGNASPGEVREQLTKPRMGGTKSADALGSQDVYIVVFTEAPLASYRGDKAGFPAPPRGAGRSGSRLNVTSTEARSYVSYLQGVQRDREQQMAAALGRAPQVHLRMQHALNAVIVEMTEAEASRVAAMSGVRMIERYREYALDTDLGMPIIGAPPVWNGTNPGAAGPYKGEGMVVGIIDTGINFGSPSFSATGPVDGYAHVNPLGSGTYLGTCASGGIDDGRCNAKLIGGYDFVCGAPVNACTTSGLREEPGFGDTNGHGSHTASTVAGNTRSVTYAGNNLQISGAAPHANIIAYDVCYTVVATGQGSCPNTATAAAVNQAVLDGIVDAINYSIGGGNDPWQDVTSLAFLSAVESGIFVAASAGNSGPAANTLGHVEPWVSSTAASQTGRNGFQRLMTVTGPAPVPTGLTSVAMTDGTGGVALAATIPGTTPLRISSGISTTSDGCAAYPANTFSGAIAVVRRGTCSFAIKANNAAAAGAIAVVIANNQAGSIAPSVPGTTVPVFAVLQTDGDALRDFGQTNPASATATIPLQTAPIANTVDALGSFSSRGPAGTYDLLKPDVTAPGVSILAAYAGTALTGSENLVEIISGTSMASPHQAGAATLIRQARPTWTAMEVKSALALTATSQVFLEDQVSLANPFARGSGRIRVDRAINAGLVLDETGTNFTAANPANGGKPSSLNIASLANRSCFTSCTFTRTFTSKRAATSTWRFDLQGLSGTVTPASAQIAAGGTQTVTVTINTTAVAADGNANFGNLMIREETSPGVFDNNATLNAPIYVAVQPPVISVPSTLSVSLASTKLATAEFDVTNIGGSTLNYTVSGGGTGSMTVANATSVGVNSGFRNTIYTDPATAGSQAQFSADDFVITETTHITSIAADGFVVSAVGLTAAAVNLMFSIYPDASGLPAGNPQSAPASAVWTYTTSPTGTGITISSSPDTAQLNLIAAGQNVTLPPGRYWLVVNTRGTFANRWAQYGSNTASGGTNGFASITIATNGTGAWTSNSSFPGLSMRIRGTVACGASWLGAAYPGSVQLAPTMSRRTSQFINAGSLQPGSYSAFGCVSSNDPTLPAAAIRVNATVTP